jgi:hypothetical protein
MNNDPNTRLPRRVFRDLLTVDLWLVVFGAHDVVRDDCWVRRR